LNADPDADFLFCADADPDAYPGYQNDADPCGSGSGFFGVFLFTESGGLYGV
jgi:hypothetical protein